MLGESTSQSQKQPRLLPFEMNCAGIAERTRNDAKRVFTFRGASLMPHAESGRILLWMAQAQA